MQHAVSTQHALSRGRARPEQVAGERRGLRGGEARGGRRHHAQQQRAAAVLCAGAARLERRPALLRARALSTPAHAAKLSAVRSCVRPRF